MKESRPWKQASFPAVECCSNPWNDVCKNANIEVYIYYEDERLPICRSCWSRIADEDISW